MTGRLTEPPNAKAPMPNPPSIPLAPVCKLDTTTTNKLDKFTVLENGLEMTNMLWRRVRSNFVCPRTYLRVVPTSNLRYKRETVVVLFKVQ